MPSSIKNFPGKVEVRISVDDLAALPVTLDAGTWNVASVIGRAVIEKVSSKLPDDKFVAVRIFPVKGMFIVELTKDNWIESSAEQVEQFLEDGALAAIPE